MWYLSYITLHCTRGITFLARPVCYMRWGSLWRSRRTPSRLGRGIPPFPTPRRIGRLAVDAFGVETRCLQHRSLGSSAGDRRLMYFRFWGWRHVFIEWSQWAKIKLDIVSSSLPNGGSGSEVWYLRKPCVKTWSHPKNRKYLTYCTAKVNMYRKFREVWTCGFWDIGADKTEKQINRHTYRHADHSTWHP